MTKYEVPRFLFVSHHSPPPALPKHRVDPRPTDVDVPRGPLGEALARQKHSPHRLAAAGGGRGEEEREEEKLGGEVNIEWRGVEQVEVLVNERKAELDADEESNGETKLKQSADKHLLKREEYGIGDGGIAVEVEGDYEGRGEEVEGEIEENSWDVEDRLRQAGESSEKEVEDKGRTVEREEGEEGRDVEDIKGRSVEKKVGEVEDIRGRSEGRQARASSVSALSVSGEKILAHRYGLAIVDEYVRGCLKFLILVFAG